MKLIELTPEVAKRMWRGTKFHKPRTLAEIQRDLEIGRQLQALQPISPSEQAQAQLRAAQAGGMGCLASGATGLAGGLTRW